MDVQSEAKLALVDSELANRVRAMAGVLAGQGITIKVTSGKRSTVQQAALYANRASNPNPVAKPGTSLHESGRAVDVGIVGHGTYAEVGRAGEAQGLRWGGRFSKPDNVHFELPSVVMTAGVGYAASFTKGDGEVDLSVGAPLGKALPLSTDSQSGLVGRVLVGVLVVAFLLRRLAE